MSEITLNVFHTQTHLIPPLTFPILATGYENWLGDGYYFWQDEYFAKWWGRNKKCSRTNLTRQYTIYKATLTFNEADFIDTVFNEEDYKGFCATVEKFARKCQINLGRKPALTEFNQFLEYYNLWENIKVIRFQDLPESDEHIEVLGSYYKKRIQIRVKEPIIITNFSLFKTFGCI